jgi:outer membrane protein OmpA-like peptidoglycan-associated protein
LAQQLQTSAIEITGYADRNGDADSNLRLSQSRTANVKSFIARLGVDDAAITTVAHGETQPLHAIQSVETDFFDRRVIVRLTDTSRQLLTDSRED